MATIIPQYTESNLVGALANSITTTATTIVVTFFDRISGAQRTPLSSTRLFVIDKGTEQFPNANYEIILAASHSTTNGITTLVGCTRGISFSGTSLAGGTGNPHIANAQIGCVDVHFLWTILASVLDGTNSPSAFKLGTRLGYELAGLAGFRDFTDATARDAAIAAPIDGDTCALSTTGVAQYYLNGSWRNIGNSSTANGDDTTDGTFQGATVANQKLATDIGSTGAHLVLQNKNLVSTSSGAPDFGKIATLNSVGQLPSGFVSALSTSVIIAKGDLIVGTAPATITNEPVGANGTILTADSSQTTGIRWGTTSGKIQGTPTGVTVGNSTTETDLLSVTIPGNALGTSNVVRAIINVNLFQLTTTGDTATFRLYYGGTAIETIGFTDSGVPAVSGVGDIEIDVVADTAALQLATLKFRCPPFLVNYYTQGLSAIDSTVNQTLRFTVQFNAAKTNNRMSTDSSFVELIA